MLFAVSNLERPGRGFKMAGGANPLMMASRRAGPRGGLFFGPGEQLILNKIKQRVLSAATVLHQEPSEAGLGGLQVAIHLLIIIYATRPWLSRLWWRTSAPLGTAPPLPPSVKNSPCFSKYYPAIFPPLS
jgi:hypothetical protein